jgi:hypothetical protein
MIPTAIIVCLFVLAAALLLIRRFFSIESELPFDVDWIEDLTADRYGPMMRLLDEGDFNYLREQPGYTPQMGARFRAQRSRLFLAYLSWIKADFARLSTALKILTLQSKDDRPDLAAAVLRHRAAFAFGLAAVHVRVVFYQLGLCGVNVRAVLQPIEAMRLDLRSLAPVSAAAAA